MDKRGSFAGGRPALFSVFRGLEGGNCGGRAIVYNRLDLSDRKNFRERLRCFQLHGCQRFSVTLARLHA